MDKQKCGEHLTSDPWKNLDAKKRRRVKSVRCAICGAMEGIFVSFGGVGVS